MEQCDFVEEFLEQEELRTWIKRKMKGEMLTLLW